MKLHCAVCNRERDETVMTIFTPSPDEKKALKKMGEAKPLDRYAYCKACTRILSNPLTAIQLMKGVIQIQARSVGVPGSSAEALAEKYGNKVLAVTPTKPRS